MAIVPGEIINLFQEHFRTGATPVVYRAPGRVNLIGEHTDYNLGYVFPIALDMACYVAIAPAQHGKLRIYSRDVNDEFALDVREIQAAMPQKKWHDYVVGVARELVSVGMTIEAADICIISQVPAGSGLSSSAALEISTAVALLGGRNMKPLDIALLGQRAESGFVGMPCGIMDQYASVFGHAGAAIQIDCRSLEHEYVEIPEDVRIFAVNSMVKHELGTSAYRDRVAECQAAVAAIQEIEPEVRSLRDVPLALFARIQESVPLTPRKRARHVISETQRVLDFAAAARANDLREMGRLFIASHRSMQYDYEITSEEIDFLVDTAIKVPGIYGARMTGGGFGGCTVNLVAPESASSFRQALTTAYEERFHITPAFYDCKPAEGAGPV
ncbi:MAG: galactokinase [Acidobacteriaceae bacterium]|nr:galactokinase [Acidobacteriaceae bacterium]